MSSWQTTGTIIVLFFSYLGYNNIVPVRQSPLNGELQALEHGELFRLWVTSITGVIDDGVMVRVVLLHGGWGHVEATTPDLYLQKSLDIISNESL